MMLGVRAHIEEKELDVASSNEELSVAEDITQEADEKELEAEAVEVEMDTQALEEAGDILEEVAEADANADKALETPAEVTEDDVKAASASLESALFALQDKSFYKDQSLKIQTAYEDYGNNPAMRLQAAQEGIKETIGRIIEAIKNIFRRVISWFKKQYAKFMVMIDRTGKKAAKLKSELNKKSESADVPADEVQFLFTKMPFTSSTDAFTKATVANTKVNWSEMFKKLGSTAEELVKTSTTKKITGNVVKYNNSKDKYGKKPDEYDDYEVSSFTDLKTKVEGIIFSYYKMVTNTIESELFKFLKDEGADETELNNILIVNSSGVKVLSTADQKLKIKTYKIPSSYLKDKYENNKNTETINKKDVMDVLNSLIKFANNNKRALKDGFKEVEDSSRIVKHLENLYKKVDNENGKELNEVAITRATNMARALSTDVVVTIMLGILKLQSDILYTASRMTASLEKKSKN